MTVKQKKELFEHYRVNVKELQRFTEAYRMYRDVGAAIATLDTNIAKKTAKDLEHEKTALCKKVSKILKEKRAIEKEIDKVKDGTEALVLRYRYIDGYGWEQISELLDYSPRNIHYMHNRAMNSIAQ